MSLGDGESFRITGEFQRATSYSFRSLLSVYVIAKSLVFTERLWVSEKTVSRHRNVLETAKISGNESTCYKLEKSLMVVTYISGRWGIVFDLTGVDERKSKKLQKSAMSQSSYTKLQATNQCLWTIAKKFRNTERFATGREKRLSNGYHGRVQREEILPFDEHL